MTLKDKKHNFDPSRVYAKSLLKDFLEAKAKQYALKRNYDFGSDQPSTVSKLSPYIRRRILTENEVVSHVLEKYSFQEMEKFIDEVLWRTYWKGWLEHRPGLWESYQRQVVDLQSTYQNNDLLLSAVRGKTGIDCFDHWVRELIDVGYLHNHARMWFASIWIYTFKLPWELGADFFFQHLFDGDPASNTLSWRWVAGLQTKGKQYLARPENIQKYTNHRFEAKGLAGALFAIPESLSFQPNAFVWPAEEISEVTPNIILTTENLSSELLMRVKTQKVWILTMKSLDHRTRLSPSVLEFDERCAEDAAKRFKTDFNVDVSIVSSGADPFSSGPISAAAYYLNQGPFKCVLDKHFENHSVQQYLPKWDSLLYPIARKGFFQFKKKMKFFIEEAVG